ncbi:ead/Ea22-like family protein [Escherichia coli]
MTALNKQALRSKARSASAGEWIKESGDGWEAICSADDQANGNFIIAHFEGPDAQANREFVQAANPDAVLALLDELEAAEKRIAELEARAFNPAILDVIAERQRQQSVEGWMPEHDDEHCNGELAMAAVCYINETGTVNRNGGKPWGWPWDASWWKPNARRRNLVKAGALILAEIERIDRAAGIGKGE